MNPEETDMGTDNPIQARSTSRFAVPADDLDSVHVTHAQMVELTSSSHRMPAAETAPMLGAPEPDSDGD